MQIVLLILRNSLEKNDSLVFHDKTVKLVFSSLDTKIPIAFSQIDNKLPVTVSTYGVYPNPTHTNTNTHTRASSKGLRAVNERTRVHRST